MNGHSPQDGGSKSEPDEETRTNGSDAFARWRTAVDRAIDRAEVGHVDLYVRSLLPAPGAKSTQTEVLRRLDAAVEDTPLDGVVVNVWGERICLCETCQDTDTGRAIADTVREFEAWGDEFDATVAPFFERRVVESSVTGGSYLDSARESRPSREGRAFRRSVGTED